MNTPPTNKVPVSIDEMISLAVKAVIGAQTVGPAIELQQNPAPKIQTDLYDLSGDPTTPLVPGKQAKYAAQKLAVKGAYDAGRAAVKSGRDFCRLAIGVLKPVLGDRWNTQWNAAGFVAPSLAVPRDPVPMLIRFREYFNANATREVAALNVTAARAQLLTTAIQQAGVTIGQARDLRLDLKAERDESKVKLRKRLIGLRGELHQRGKLPGDVEAEQQRRRAHGSRTVCGSASSDSRSAQRRAAHHRRERPQQRRRNRGHGGKHCPLTTGDGPRANENRARQAIELGAPLSLLPMETRVPYRADFKAATLAMNSELAKDDFEQQP